MDLFQSLHCMTLSLRWEHSSDNTRAANKLNGSRIIPVKRPSAEPNPSLPSRAVKSEGLKDTSLKPGTEYPAIATSNIKLDGKPVYEPVGKPITQVDLDEGKEAPEFEAQTAHRLV
jgi:hypothetical protein